MNRNAFTILEVMMTILILSIIAGIVLPRSEPNSNEQLRAAAQIVRNEILYARALALTYSDRYKVVFDPQGGKMTLKHSGTNAVLHKLPKTAFQSLSAAGTEQVFDFQSIPNVGMRIELAAVSRFSSLHQNETEIEFTPLGSTTATEETWIWLSCGRGVKARYVTIVFEPLTGLATVETISATPPPLNL